MGQQRYHCNYQPLWFVHPVEGSVSGFGEGSPAELALVAAFFLAVDHDVILAKTAVGTAAMIVTPLLARVHADTHPLFGGQRPNKDGAGPARSSTQPSSTIPWGATGWRARQGKWIFWALFYSVPFVLAMGFGIGTGDEGVSLRWLGDWNVVLTIVLGIVSVFHAFRVRNEYLMRLAGVQGTKRKKDEILKRLLRNEGSLRREGQQRTTFASEEASSYKDLLSVCSKHTRNDWSGYYVGEKIPLKKTVNAFTY